MKILYLEPINIAFQQQRFPFLSSLAVFRFSTPPSMAYSDKPTTVLYNCHRRTRTVLEHMLDLLSLLC